MFDHKPYRIFIKYISGNCTFRFIKPILTVFFITSSIVNYAQTPKQNADVTQSNAYKNSQVTYRLVPSGNNTYGYDIYLDGALIIHQPSRPAMPGNAGFATKEKAAAVAKIVIEKIKKGEMPPTITVEELKKAKAI